MKYFDSEEKPFFFFLNIMIFVKAMFTASD